MFRILQNLLDLLHFVTIRYQVFEFSERALGGIGAWWSCGSLAGRGVRKQEQSVCRYQLSVFLGVAQCDSLIFDLSWDVSSQCGNVDVDIYQNCPWNSSAVVLCLNLEGLHGFELREKFVSGQCWCSMQDYHWLHNNCLKFANEFCRKLGSIQYKLPFVYIIYIYILHFQAPHLFWSIQTYPRLAWRCWWNSCVAESLVLLCKSISFNSLLNHQSIRTVFDPYIYLSCLAISKEWGNES